MPFAHFNGLKSLFHGSESRQGGRSIARRAALSRRPLAEQLEDRKLLTYLMINDRLVTEGASGTSELAFTVSLAATTSNTVTVNYQTADASATAGPDYVATQGTLSFAPGEKTKPISVTIVGDNIVELAEAFHLRLSNPVNANLIKNLGIGTIIDNDTPVAPELSINDPRITEGDGGTRLLTYNVSLNTAVYDRAVSVKVQTLNATAIAGEDYVAKTEVLTFSPGQTVKPFSVTVYGDTKFENPEAFYAVMSEETVAVKKRNGVGFILNDD